MIKRSEESEAPGAWVIAEAGDFTSEAQEFGDVREVESVVSIRALAAVGLSHGTSLFIPKHLCKGFGRLKRRRAVTGGVALLPGGTRERNKDATDRFHTDTGHGKLAEREAQPWDGLSV